jgi:hypothetical protein
MATQNNKSSKAKNDKPAPAKPVAKAPVPTPVPAPAPAKPVKAAVPVAASYQPTKDEIQARAFEIYVSEGCKEGSDLENWLRAEKDLRTKGPR